MAPWPRKMCYLCKTQIKICKLKFLWFPPYIHALYASVCSYRWLEKYASTHKCKSRFDLMSNHFHLTWHCWKLTVSSLLTPCLCCAAYIQIISAWRWTSELTDVCHLQAFHALEEKKPRITRFCVCFCNRDTSSSLVPNHSFTTKVLNGDAWKFKGTWVK